MQAFRMLTVLLSVTALFGCMRDEFAMDAWLREVDDPSGRSADVEVSITVVSHFYNKRHVSHDYHLHSIRFNGTAMQPTGEAGMYHLHLEDGFIPGRVQHIEAHVTDFGGENEVLIMNANLTALNLAGCEADVTRGDTLHLTWNPITNSRDALTVEVLTYPWIAEVLRVNRHSSVDVCTDTIDADTVLVRAYRRVQHYRSLSQYSMHHELHWSRKVAILDGP